MRTKLFALSILSVTASILPSFAKASQIRALDDNSRRLQDSYKQKKYADDCQFIRDAIDAMPRSGGKIVVPPGTYNCRGPIIIAKNNILLQGSSKDRSKTTFRLADWVHAPLLVVGAPMTELIPKEDEVRRGKTLESAPKAHSTLWRTVNVQVENFTFDGNLAKHDPTKECGETHCDGDVGSIRNNAVSIRGSSYITIKNINSHSSISGGLVTEKFCDHLLVEDFESSHNYFDGFAGYETEYSVFKNVNLHTNRGAGISIDIAFNNNTFDGGKIENTGDVGIFARYLSGNKFKNLDIINPGSAGVFMASDVTDDPTNCAKDNMFENVNIINPKGAPFLINDGCTGNVIKGISVLQTKGPACVVEKKSATGTPNTLVDASVRCELL